MNGIVEKHQSLRVKIKETSFVAEIRGLFWRKSVCACKGSGFCSRSGVKLCSLLYAHLDEQQP